MKGLFTIGTNDNNESVRVPLGFIEDSTDAANNAAENANNAAKNANEAAASANEAAGAANEAAGAANNAACDANAAAGTIFNELKKYIPRSLLGAINGVASLDAQGKVPIAQLLTEGNGGLVLRSLLGAINGVATLDGGRLVWDDQLRMGWRGYYTGDIDATNIKPGIWGIDNRSLGAAILGDELAHGILVQFCDTQHRNYRTQVLLVGRNAQSPNGDALEIYARRYLPGKSGWGEWYSSAKTEYTLTKTGSNIELKKNGTVVGRVADANTTYSTMSQAEAEAGTATSARTMSAKILKAAIEKHTEDKATIGFVNSSIQTATAEFRGTHPSLEALQAVEADRNDYGYVEETDTDGNILVHRYKYVEGTGWQFEYDLNRTGFTAAEWQAIKSGITPEDVEKLRELPEKDAVMPLTRITDRTKVEAVVDADDCTEPGIYENVQKPGIPNDFGLIITTPGEVCVLLVSEIYGENNHEVAVSIDSNGSQQVSEMFYKELVQFAVGKDFAAVRTCRKCLSSTDGRISTPTFTPWKQFAMKSDLRGNFKVEDIVIQYGGGPLPPPSKEFLGKILLMLDEKYDMYDNVGVPYYLRNMDYDDETGEIIYDWQPMVDLTNIPTRKQIEKDILPKNAPKLNRYKVGEEVLVGEWEENGVTYDLYRKVVSFGELPNAGQKTVAHGISNKVKFVGVSAMASNGFPIPFVTQNIDKAIYLALGNNQITINTHATDRSALTADVTIEFTRAKK